MKSKKSKNRFLVIFLKKGEKGKKMANSYLGYRIPEVQISPAQVNDIVETARTSIATNGFTMLGGVFRNAPAPVNPYDLATKRICGHQAEAVAQDVLL